MDWQQIWTTVQNWLTNTGIKILIAILLLVISFPFINWLGKKIAKRGEKLKEKKHIDTTVYRTLSYIAKVGLKILVVISLIAYLGIDTSALTALIASLGVGVGLAVNGTLSNFAGGVLLLFTRPFKDGDYISANGFEGTVEDIFICNTKVRTNDNKVIYLPNGKLSTSEIVNYTEKGKRRLDVTFGVSYDDDFEKAKSLIAEVVAANDKIHTDPAPNIRVTAQSASSIDITCMVWCNGDDYWNNKFYLLEEVKRKFDE
ncbi:MAG: mechanosensitive ion channel family protein, partial [Firmicutes bacterium]|nr:mechanosensitive ion channel family protein [Bacillota bacterium]